MATQSTFEISLLRLNGSHLVAWDLPELSTGVLMLDVWLGGICTAAKAS